MGKKLTIDFVRSEFEKEGCALLTTVYKNNLQKLDYVCSNGHSHSINWSSWQQGSRCSYCAGNAKPTIDFIKSEFEKEGYQLLTTTYESSKQKLSYICPNYHKHSITWENWRRGCRCKICGIESRTNKKRLSLSFIKSEFEKEGYRLLTTEYKNAQQKLDYICPNGHQHSISWGGWKNGYRCSVCAGNAKPTIDFIRSEFEKEGYQLLTTEYKNNSQKLDYACFNGHQHSIRWNDWKKGARCPTCANINRSGPGHPNWKGGISCAPYCDIWADKEYKSDIRDRDGNKCLNPYCLHNDAVLNIHHIDYDKKNCAPQNLITVCNSCNTRANTNRDWHTEWYRTILNKRYGYNY